MADSWWEPSGVFKPLHAINNSRIQFIKEAVAAGSSRTQQHQQHLPFQSLKMIDVGCGGGLVAESLARLGADKVVGVDASPVGIQIAKRHLLKDSSISDRVEYFNGTVDDYVSSGNNNRVFDVVLALEIIEHLADPLAFLKSLRSVCKPSSGVLILSCPNRSLLSLLGNIVAAEYLFRLVPPGTHNFMKFLTPQEVNQLLLQSDFTLAALSAIAYNPFTSKSRLTAPPSLRRHPNVSLAIDPFLQLNFILAAKPMSSAQQQQSQR